MVDSSERAIKLFVCRFICFPRSPYITLKQTQFRLLTVRVAFAIFVLIELFGNLIASLSIAQRFSHTFVPVDSIISTNLNCLASSADELFELTCSGVHFITRDIINAAIRYRVFLCSGV